MLASSVTGAVPVRSMTTRLRRLSCCVTLAAVLVTAAAPTLAQPIEAGSQDALESPGRYDQEREQPHSRWQDRRDFYPVGRGRGTAYPESSAATPPQAREYGDAPSYGGYGSYGASGYGDGAGYGTTVQPGGDGGAYGEGRGARVAPFGGGPGYQTPIPLGAGSLYSGSAVNGTAVGPQYSNQLPAYEGRPRR